jgi:hypothetical protein
MDTRSWSSKDINIKERLLAIPKVNKYSEAEWLKDADCEINKKNYCKIEELGQWFCDEALTTGFALLNRILKCKKHKMSLYNPWAANALFTYFYQPRVPLKGHEIAAKCQDMDFIVLPVSDGFEKM